MLSECGIFHVGLHGKCPSKCDETRRTVATSASFSVSQISMHRNLSSKKLLKLLDMYASFCPNFIVSLCNFIEFFWGAVKKYLCDNCNYIFATLKENTPKALAVVKLSTIHLWEHLMYWWMEAYRLGLDPTAAQHQVRKFSLHKCKSHRHIPETIACSLDAV